MVSRQKGIFQYFTSSENLKSFWTTMWKKKKHVGQTHTPHCAQKQTFIMFLDLLALHNIIKQFQMYLLMQGLNTTAVSWGKIPLEAPPLKAAVHPPLSAPISLLSICGLITKSFFFFISVPGIAKRNHFLL